MAHPGTLLPLGLLVVLSGCVAGGQYSLSGTFTEDATQADMEDLGDRVAAHGGTLDLMESFPVQFSASGLDNNGCDAVREEALARDYVAAVGSCTDGET